METLIAGTKVDTTLVVSRAGQWSGKVTITLDDGAIVTANVKSFGEDVELHDIEGDDAHAAEAVELYRDVYETELAKYLGRA
jgi:major membrane immunogen (membrane-anchored lipoprotein)